MVFLILDINILIEAINLHTFIKIVNGLFLFDHGSWWAFFSLWALNDLNNLNLLLHRHLNLKLADHGGVLQLRFDDRMPILALFFVGYHSFLIKLTLLINEAHCFFKLQYIFGRFTCDSPPRDSANFPWGSKSRDRHGRTELTTPERILSLDRNRRTIRADFGAHGRTELEPQHRIEGCLSLI